MSKTNNFLRRLELQGFKSFAGKTVLEFPERVTAIVGPNGSGKSNVIDALRWVLGEREAKQLRGDTLENLIFGGTPKKAAAGLAKVSLVFDNRENIFPGESPEVELSRKADRSGVSEFNLQDAEIKLKDLTPILARARLGARGLVMIGQGQSDMFVKATPAERRAMIEEVLGLREFRLKKAQSERRLEHTATNMEKARALLAEIEPHLKFLRRQKSRFERRSEVETELRRLENSFFAIRYQKESEILKSIEPQIKEAEASLAIVYKEVQILEAEAKNANQAFADSGLDKLRADLANARFTLQDLERRAARLDAQLEFRPAPEAIKHPAEETTRFLSSVEQKLSEALNLETVEAIKAVRGVVEGIRKFFAPGGKSEAQNDTEQMRAERDEIKKKIILVETEAKSLAQKEEEILRGQANAHEAFRLKVGAAEEKKNILRSAEQKLQTLKFERERANIKLEDVAGDFRGIGRDPVELPTLKISEDLPEAGLPAQAGEAERKIYRLRGEIAAIGEIDQTTVQEAEEVEGRAEFLTKELADLERAATDLSQVVKELDERIHEDFKKAFKNIDREFDAFFKLMFGGGKAGMKLVTPPKPTLVEGETAEINTEAGPEDLEAGVEIDLQVPRKRITSLEMLSGGEKSLVSLAALFALIAVTPPPFLVLDEIDAPLDEENARRFAELVKNFSAKTQFIIVTHNRATMEAADVLYGVTMGDDGVSQLLSLKFEEVVKK
jgi:chromosome segregation protein